VFVLHLFELGFNGSDFISNLSQLNVAWGRQNMLPRRYAFSTLPKAWIVLSSHVNLLKSPLTTKSWSESTSPFAILGFDDTNVASLNYDQVKQAFLKLALKHHPDRPGGSADHFRRVRHAFEQIRELPNGTLVCVDDMMIHNNYDKNSWTEAQKRHYDTVQNWMNHHLSFHMNTMTRKEVSHVAKTMAPGGLDKGGMWELAKLVAMEEEEERKATPNHSNTPPTPIALAMGELANSQRRQRRR
jgi:hypothetical protein